MRRFPVSVPLAALAVFALVACSGGEKSGSITKKAEPVVTVEDLQRLQGHIDQGHPGRGATDYPGNTVEDVPKSYAMVLLAELARKKHLGTTDFRNLEATAGQWLLDHADENRDGVIGWGVPVAWDAYGDDSENPAHTEYSISTAIVLDALLSWREVVAGPKAEEILRIAERSATPYLRREMWSPAGMLPYSLRESDRRYDTFNSAMYLAGQLQRLANLTTSKELAEKLQDAADSTVAALIQHRQISPESGAWYWNYSVSEPTPNDLPHASYIAVGLADYVRYGGRLAGQIKLDSVLEHINEFMPTALQTSDALRPFIRAWPRFRKDVTLEARSYDLGMALHLACTYQSLNPLRRALFDAVPDYRTSTGEYQKYPVRSTHPPLVVAEYESYLYRGLADCLVATAPAAERRTEGLPQRPGATSTLRAEVMRALAPRSLVGEIEVPFVRLSAEGQSASVQYTPETMMARVMLSDGNSIRLPYPGVPVALIGTGSKQAIFMRSLPEGELLLVSASGGNRLLIRHAPDREPMFRVATLHQGRLYLVYYDNPTLSNWLLRLEHGPTGWQPIGAAVKLPSLEDPAGRTYEMIPRVEFVSGGGRLWFAGGGLKAEIDTEGNVREGRFNGCMRAVEVVLGPDGPLALCANKDASDPAWIIAGAPQQPALDLKRGVPWNLRMVGNVPVVDYAASPKKLLAMLTRDLQRAQQSGWMEFGINNEEGRIPWSQIYYLNGFLDLIALALADDGAAQMFMPLIPAVRQRLDMEMALIDAHWREGRYRTRAFTVDRSSALFAVQTGRLLLLMNRYKNELPQALPLASYSDVRSAVTSLRGHIEVLSRRGESPSWMAAGRPHLRWPKGSKFSFDGLNVPFNHQNEWAYAVLRAGSPETRYRDAAQQIISYFGEQIAPGGMLPTSGVWNYWWGKAYDGWSETEGVSVNRPSYSGDKIKAWISFRTIDAMAFASAYDSLPSPDRERMIESVGTLVQQGKVYPFASYELLRLQMLVLPSWAIALRFARVSSPWELQNAVWALVRLST